MFILLPRSHPAVVAPARGPAQGDLSNGTVQVGRAAPGPADDRRGYPHVLQGWSRGVKPVQISVPCLWSNLSEHRDVIDRRAGSESPAFRTAHPSSRYALSSAGGLTHHPDLASAAAVMEFRAELT